MIACVKCQIELRPLENGIVAMMMAKFGPYELYSADLWHCSGCGWKGVSGLGNKPWARHHDEGFLQVLEDVELNRTVIKIWKNENEKHERALYNK